MIVSRRFPRVLTMAFALRLAPIGGGWAFLVYVAYAYLGLNFLRIPFLPIATIGTAVAFYIGFKNNAAYERFWEGRKIWGGIVNESRSWATAVLSYIGPDRDDPQWREIRRDLIYRQLAWINALRLQLRKTSRFYEKPAPSTKRRLQRHAELMRNDWDAELTPFLTEDEVAQTKSEANAATQLLRRQGAALAKLLREQKIDLFHQIALMDIVRELYALQGKCERIKNTPFPRQYAEYSRIFTHAFVFTVPLGLLDVFGDHVDAAASTLETLAPVVPMILSAAAIYWVFVTMEGIGDASEDPFERSMNDVPMNALCRTIEIDLRQMLGETDLPAKEPAADGILY